MPFSLLLLFAYVMRFSSTGLVQVCDQNTHLFIIQYLPANTLPYVPQCSQQVLPGVEENTPQDSESIYPSQSGISLSHEHPSPTAASDTSPPATSSAGESKESNSCNVIRVKRSSTSPTRDSTGSTWPEADQKFTAGEGLEGEKLTAASTATVLASNAEVYKSGGESKDIETMNVSCNERVAECEAGLRREGVEGIGEDDYEDEDDIDDDVEHVIDEDGQENRYVMNIPTLIDTDKDYSKKPSLEVLVKLQPPALIEEDEESDDGENTYHSFERRDSRSFSQVSISRRASISIQNQVGTDIVRLPHSTNIFEFALLSCGHYLWTFLPPLCSKFDHVLSSRPIMQTKLRFSSQMVSNMQSPLRSSGRARSHREKKHGPIETRLLHQQRLRHYDSKSDVFCLHAFKLHVVFV